MKNNYAIILSILTVFILIALKVFNNIQKKNNNKAFYNISFNEGIELNQIEIISSKKIDLIEKNNNLKSVLNDNENKDYIYRLVFEDKIELQNFKTNAFNDLLSKNDDILEQQFSSCIKEIEREIVRKSILEKSERIDGRNLDKVRDISCEVGVFDNVHGSALFIRGETQALVFTTLGTSQDEQILDRIDGEFREKFMLHYNFPPYSVNEVGRIGSTGRREIGHGKLAWRALNPILSQIEDIRIQSV